MNKRVSGLEEELEKTEEKLLAASQKLGLASTAGDDSQRMCKVLENKALSDEARMETLTNQLKDARNMAEEADKKYDEIAKKLQAVEADLERAEERAETGKFKLLLKTFTQEFLGLIKFSMNLNSLNLIFNHFQN